VMHQHDQTRLECDRAGGGLGFLRLPTWLSEESIRPGALALPADADGIRVAGGGQHLDVLKRQPPGAGSFDTETGDLKSGAAGVTGRLGTKVPSNNAVTISNVLVNSCACEPDAPAG
jgi:hypothetical protein